MIVENHSRWVVHVLLPGDVKTMRLTRRTVMISGMAKAPFVSVGKMPRWNMYNVDDIIGTANCRFFSAS